MIMIISSSPCMVMLKPVSKLMVIQNGMWSFSDAINLIKSVMRNIQLPSSAIPEWAKKIPEEKWKQPLVSALQQRTSRTSDENVDKISDTQS